MDDTSVTVQKEITDCTAREVIPRLKSSKFSLRERRHLKKTIKREGRRLSEYKT